MKIYSATINNSSPGIIIIPSHIEKLNLEVNEMIRLSFVISLLDAKYNGDPLLTNPINSNLKLSNIQEFNKNFIISFMRYKLQVKRPSFILELCYYILLLFTYLTQNDREILMTEVILKPFYDILVDLNGCNGEKELILEFMFKCQKRIRTVNQAYSINLYYDDITQSNYMKIIDDVFYNGEKNDYLVHQRLFTKSRIDKYQILFDTSVQNFLLKNFDKNINNTIKKMKNKQQIDINERIEIMLYPILKEVQQTLSFVNYSDMKYDKE